MDQIFCINLKNKYSLRKNSSNELFEIFEDFFVWISEKKVFFSSSKQTNFFSSSFKNFSLNCIFFKISVPRFSMEYPFDKKFHDIEEFHVHFM